MKLNLWQKMFGKNRRWSPELWLLLLAGFGIFEGQDNFFKTDIPIDPPKLISFHTNNCDYFWYQNVDANFTLKHKDSCTNITHQPHVFIQIPFAEVKSRFQANLSD